ncbi:phosphatase PAP2 family protein [Halomonas sp. PAMB 3232]|uniref:phosphatase PAP2 family protein n=1 Tax=Halomonas sp. PAMB 3232 TaxID=3075221 RepID=UPI0028968E10|nr:phosphatase PAP2 family protein [Halomonas sp. PAMB 3232]WNL40595.1 phosphatase PAP2 family protein [Halomonas sp. PAMB 3232]
MKLGFDRPRPDLAPHEAMIYTASFSSGHSMMFGVTYLTLAVLLIRIQPALRLNAYLLILAILLTLLGWTAGASWAAICWGVMHWMQGRRQIEKEESEAGSD